MEDTMNKRILLIITLFSLTSVKAAYERIPESIGDGYGFGTTYETPVVREESLNGFEDDGQNPYLKPTPLPVKEETPPRRHIGNGGPRHSHQRGMMKSFDSLAKPTAQRALLPKTTSASKIDQKRFKSGIAAVRKFLEENKSFLSIMLNKAANGNHIDAVYFLQMYKKALQDGDEELLNSDLMVEFVNLLLPAYAAK
jgi:hypothetical protein